MIESVRNAQRADLELFGQGLADLFAGVDSNEAEAASLNMASILVLMAQSVTDNKWSR